MNDPKSAGQAIVTRPANQSHPQDPIRLAQLLAESGYFKDAKQAAQAAVKVMAGAELGFDPIASMTGVAIIDGRVTLSANLIAAAIKSSGRYTYEVQSLTDTECSLRFLEKGKEIGISSFSIKDATKANLLKGDNWKSYPRNMLFARAVSNGAKWYCPDIFGGPVYTPDELGADVDGETGEITSEPDTEVKPELTAEPTDPKVPTITPAQADELVFELQAREMTVQGIITMFTMAGIPLRMVKNDRESLKQALKALNQDELREINRWLDNDAFTRGGEQYD